MIKTAAARIGYGVPAVLVGAAVVVGSALVGTGAAHATPVPVLAGHALVTTVPGFAPGAVVQLRLDRVIMAGTSRADRRGFVHVRLPAPAAPGPHRLMLVGAVASTRPSGADAGGASGDDRQTVVVVVPRLVTLDFRVVPSLGVDAEGPVDHHGDSHHAGGLGTAGESATADTGSNVALPAWIGAALVVVGAAMALFGRRRSTS